MDGSSHEMQVEGKPLVDVAPETPTGQSRLAYRLAAGILLLNVALSFVRTLVACDEMFSTTFIALIVCALAVGLILLRRGARTITLVLAFLLTVLAVSTTIGLVQTDRAKLAIPFLLPALAIPAALTLLLTGKTTPWRLALGTGLFVVGNLAVRVWDLLRL